MHYPVHLEVTPPARYSRLGLLLRILAVTAVAAVGVSSGGIFCLLYVGLPVLAAVRISSLGSSGEYARRDGRRLLFVFGWLAAVTAWLRLVVDRLPSERPEETVRLRVDGEPRQTAAAAVARVVLGLPSAAVLMLLSFVGVFVWVWAALSILLTEAIPRSAWAYLAGLERYAFRLLAYQAGLVDEYPPFGLSEAPDIMKAHSAL